MISNEKYSIQVVVSNGSDEIDVTDGRMLKALEMNEVVGGDIPLGTMELSIFNEEYIWVLNENNVVTITVESNDSDNKWKRVYYLTVISVLFPNKGQSEIDAVVTMCGDYLSFFRNPHTRIFKDHNSITSIWKIMVLNGIALMTDIRGADDKQNWVQTSEPDAEFVGSIVKSMNLGDTFPMYALTLEGSALLYSYSYLKSMESIPVGNGLSHIPFVSVDNPHQETVITNTKYGYGLSWSQFDADKYESTNLSMYSSPSWGITTKGIQVRDLDISPKQLGMKVITGNHHKDYYVSMARNIINTGISDSFRVKVYVKNYVNAFSLLNKVRLFVPSSSDNTKESKVLGGDYLVLQKRMRLVDQEILIELTLGRQSINF